MEEAEPRKDPLPSPTELPENVCCLFKRNSSRLAPIERCASCKEAGKSLQQKKRWPG